VCIAGGLHLVSIRAAENNVIVMLANGIGVYCIGKGLYAIASTALLGRGKQ